MTRINGDRSLIFFFLWSVLAKPDSNEFPSCRVRLGYIFLLMKLLQLPKRCVGNSLYLRFSRDRIASNYGVTVAPWWIESQICDLLCL